MGRVTVYRQFQPTNSGVNFYFLVICVQCNIICNEQIILAIEGYEKHECRPTRVVIAIIETFCNRDSGSVVFNSGQ